VPGPILDTSVLLRHLLDDHEEHSPRATALLRKIEAGDFKVELPITVLFETTYTMQKTYGLAKGQILEHLEALLDLRGLTLSEPEISRRTVELFRLHNISFADAYHAALTERLKPPQILAFDRGFDRIKTVERIEP
jgi:predicted nucleic acid-binding protein